VQNWQQSPAWILYRPKNDRYIEGEVVNKDNRMADRFISEVQRMQQLRQASGSVENCSRPRFEPPVASEAI
jgi:hypothetical protein